MMCIPTSRRSRVFFVPKRETANTRIADDQHGMKKKTLTLLLIAIALSAEAHAFTGTVVDRDTGRPLTGATISVVGRGSLTLSDSLGAFSLPTTANVDVHISHIGYASETLRVGVTPRPLIIKLKPVPIQLPAVDVVREADRTEALARQPAFTAVIERDAFGQQVTSLPEVLDRSAGLKVQSMGGLGAFSTISVRGSSSEQIEVYLDGVLMNAASGGGRKPQQSAPREHRQDRNQSGRWAGRKRPWGYGPHQDTSGQSGHERHKRLLGIVRHTRFQRNHIRSQRTNPVSRPSRLFGE